VVGQRGSKGAGGQLKRGEGRKEMMRRGRQEDDEVEEGVGIGGKQVP